MRTLFKFAISLTLALAVSLAAGNSARADRRIALVIGNAKYQHAGILSKAVNDAKAVTDLLKGVGFDEVDQRSDLGVDEFRQAVQEFIQLSFNADVAVIYFSGYGSAIDGVNYLIPVDATLSSSREVEDQAVSLNWVLVAAGGARKLSLVILDACRGDPLPPTNEDSRSTHGVSLGVADVTLGVPNTLTVLAAKAGSASFDGDGANTPFVSALAKYIAQPGLDIRLALGKVHDEVLKATANRQEPHVYGSLDAEDVALVPATPGAGAAQVELAAAARLDEDLDYRIAQRIGSLEGWRSFLAAHWTGFHAQAAQAEVDRLLVAEKVPAPAAEEVSNGDVSSIATAPDELAPPGAPSPRTEAATAPTPDSVKTSNGVASSSASAAEIAPPGRPFQRTETAALIPDQSCKREGERIERLRANPSWEEIARLANELICEKLRPQLTRLIESLEYPAPAPVNVAATPSITTAAQEIGHLAPSSPRTNVATLPPDQGCKHEGERLERMRANPSWEEIARFTKELGCEQLRPQLERLIDSLGDAAPAPAAAPRNPSSKESLAPGPRRREAAAQNSARFTAASRGPHPRRQAGSTAFWRGSGLPPIIGALIGEWPKRPPTGRAQATNAWGTRWVGANADPAAGVGTNGVGSGGGIARGGGAGGGGAGASGGGTGGGAGGGTSGGAGGGGGAGASSSGSSSAAGGGGGASSGAGAGGGSSSAGGGASSGAGASGAAGGGAGASGAGSGASGSGGAAGGGSASSGGSGGGGGNGGGNGNGNGGGNGNGNGGGNGNGNGGGNGNGNGNGGGSGHGGGSGGGH
jgi:hypothetical protein